MISIILNAHQADVSSTMLVERSPNDWVIQVRSALTAFEHEVKVQFGDDTFNTPEEFKRLVIAHLERNLSIKINEQEIKISNGIVKLGHETSAVFELLDIPKKIETINVINTNFIDIPRNQSELMIFKEHAEREQFILDSKNKHSVKLGFDNSKFTLLEKGSNMRIGYFIFSSNLSIAIILFVFVFYYLIKVRRVKMRKRTELIEVLYQNTPIVKE